MRENPLMSARRPRWRGPVGLVAVCLVSAAFVHGCAVPPGISPGPSPRDLRADAQVSPQSLSPEWLAERDDRLWAGFAARQSVGAAAMPDRPLAVLQQLIRVAPALDPSTARWRAQVLIVDDDGADLWCLGDGRCALTRGMLRLTAGNEQRLAALLAHELAHVLRGHSAERIALLRQTGADESVEALLRLPYSRAHEIEADRIGVEWLARAGFDPRAAIGVWGSEAARAAPAYLTRHPAPPSRMTDLDRYSRRVQPLIPPTGSIR